VTTNIRRQLTLFVEPTDAEIIEQVRHTFNPAQFELIKAHVTLCREDEIQLLDQVIANILLLAQPEIIIEFKKVERFDHGKGLFLPAKTGNSAFDELRRQVLAGLTDKPIVQIPHITLMHPRNSTCTDDIFRQVEKMILPAKLKFKTISLIEQQDGRQWKIVSSFDLANKT